MYNTKGIYVELPERNPHFLALHKAAAPVIPLPSSEVPTLEQTPQTEQ